MISSSKIEVDCIKLDANKGANEIISRLAQKLKNKSASIITGYSRMHNRHNRS